MYIIRIHTHNHNKNNKNKITIFKLYHSSGRVWSPNARLYSMNAHSTMRKIVAVVVVFAQFFAFLVALFVCCTVVFFFSRSTLRTPVSPCLAAHPRARITNTQIIPDDKLQNSPHLGVFECAAAAASPTGGCVRVCVRVCVCVC